MPIIIAIINRKGGVGKTATTKNLAFALSKLGKKVAVADQDNSDNLTFGVDRDNLPFDYIKSDRSYAILSKFKELDYDIILLDNPPTLGQEATSSLLIADYVLIPANFTFYVEKGIIGIFESIKEIQKINPKLKLLGVLINMFDKREKDNLSKLLRRDVLAEIVQISKTNLVDYNIIQEK